MKFKARIALILLAILMLIVPAAVAQDGTFGLSPEDFALLTSQDFDADSVSFDFALDLAVTGAPGAETAVALTGAGLFGMGADGMPAGSFEVTGSAVTGGETVPVNFQLIIVDGLLYFNLGDGSGWIGQPLDSAMESFMNAAPQPMNPMDLASGNMSEDPEAMEAMGAAMGALGSMNPEDFISIARLGDTEGMAHFRVDLDLASFFASDAFTELLGTAGTMSGDESIGEMGPLVAMMLQDVRLSLDEFISTADNRAREALLDFGLTVDPAMMGDPEADPVTVAFTLQFSSLDYNVPVSVTAPADAVVIPSSQ